MHVLSQLFVLSLFACRDSDLWPSLTVPTLNEHENGSMVIEQIKFIIEREEKNKQQIHATHIYHKLPIALSIFILISLMLLLLQYFFFVDFDIFPFLNSNEIKNTTHFIWSCQLKRNRKCHKFHVFFLFWHLKINDMEWANVRSIFKISRDTNGCAKFYPSNLFKWFNDNFLIITQPRHLKKIHQFLFPNLLVNVYLTRNVVDHQFFSSHSVHFMSRLLFLEIDQACEISWIG